jgi:hypothetical protein
MPKPKMVTVEQRAVGTFKWNDSDQARIERSLFAFDGGVTEKLRFCKNRNGRHNRVHLVIEEENFVKLFRSAVENGVFSEASIRGMREVLLTRHDPFLDVIGTTGDGKLSAGIDEELYGESPA